MKIKVVEGTAGGGAVTATANGKKEILSLKISPDAVDPEDIETLEDLVMVAVNDAVKKADDMMAEGMSAVTGGINIPGLIPNMHATVIENLIEKFEQLPGIGRKSAERIAFHILEHMSKEDAVSMSNIITEAKEKITLCPVCQNLTDTSPCKICSSPKRDNSVICVVESPEDVSAIEATNEFNGLYHVLHGSLSPMDGITPDDIKINELLLRLSDSTVKEVIMATNPTVNGTATAVYISKLLAPFDVKVTRIAHGIPIGSDLEYADKITLIKALEGRQTM